MKTLFKKINDFLNTVQPAWTAHFLITVLLLKQIHFWEEKPRESVTERANRETERGRGREGVKGCMRKRGAERGRDL